MFVVLVCLHPAYHRELDLQLELLNYIIYSLLSQPYYILCCYNLTIRELGAAVVAAVCPKVPLIPAEQASEDLAYSRLERR